MNLPRADAIEQIEQIQEAWAQIAETFLSALQALSEALSKWWIEVRRHYLYWHLRCWHFPHGLAYWLAQHWPERWLPHPNFPVEEEP